MPGRFEAAVLAAADHAWWLGETDRAGLAVARLLAEQLDSLTSRPELLGGRASKLSRQVTYNAQVLQGILNGLLLTPESRPERDVEHGFDEDLNFVRQLCRGRLSGPT
ncbi:MAG TPA: hypothetical protein VHM29_01470 [Acidimicrobiia bacterium]|jgi:hypothetical protein|nr:hypothetical protein [Acidimicrobiia bacterium]